MLFCTGDLHGHIDIKKLNSKNWVQGSTLTKDDYLIVAGDFGLVWDHTSSSKQEKYWIDWLSSKPWVTLFVDGNHENHPRLNQLPTETMFGSDVGVLTDSIYHLRRGRVYLIPDVTSVSTEVRKVFTFGGADSIDQAQRIVGISWWPSEIPSRAEFDLAWENLEHHQWEVDFVVTHTAPTSVLLSRGITLYRPYDPVQEMLEQMWEKLEYKHWWFGHWHRDLWGDKDTFLYQRIVRMKC